MLVSKVSLRTRIRKNLRTMKFAAKTFGCCCCKTIFKTNHTNVLYKASNKYNKHRRPYQDHVKTYQSVQYLSYDRINNN